MRICQVNCEAVVTATRPLADIGIAVTPAAAPRCKEVLLP